MKLFSWTHRKLHKDATGSLKASVAGNSGLYVMQNSSANNQGEHITPSNDIKKAWETNQQCQHHLKEFNSENTKDYNENQPTEIFPGFLTIGTLSVEPISEPPTPTLELPNQAINESIMAEMKFDLKLVNEELEKFLKFEAEKEGNIDSSRKNSQASSITLGDEVKEDVCDHNSVVKQVYPLQGYLLGSSTDLMETKPKGKKEKACLYELFKNTTMDRNSTKESESTQKQTIKKLKLSDLMNKMLYLTQISPNISNHSTNHAAESFPAPKKLKIKQLFHQKVHPEISKAASATKEPKDKKEKKKNLNSGNSYIDSSIRRRHSRISCWGSLKKGKNHCANADTKLPDEAITKNNLDLLLKDTSGGVGKEHWIKTDEEYFILELQQKNGGVQN